MAERTCPIEDCARPVGDRGFCRAHGHRLRRYGDPLGKPVRPTMAERFWSRVEIRGEDECWPWTGGYNSSDGRGAFYLDGKNRPAPRISLILDGRPVPEGMFACHSCDNPPCVNPRHLWIGDQSANLADMAAKGRSVKGRPRGHAE